VLMLEADEVAVIVGVTFDTVTEEQVAVAPA
jgi:hypothetical protein